MGQVFTWKDVREGRIPQQADFDEAVQLLRERVLTADSIVAAQLFGSVARGDAGCRSDVDCVVIYDTHQEQAAMEVLQRISVLALRRHVPINFAPCNTVLGRTRLHHLGPSFVGHLRATKLKGQIIGDPTDWLKETVSAKEEIEGYIKTKMYNLEEAWTQLPVFSEERRVAFLKKCLEATMHVARKMLAYEHRLDGDSKWQVQQQYLRAGSPELAELFHGLLSLDGDYTAELNRQFERLNRRAYVKMLTRLEAGVPNLIKFLRLNILRIEAAR